MAAQLFKEETPEGARVGPYEVLFTIATGGMARVYAARRIAEHGFQQLVALKLMLPHMADDERFAEMFIN
ncbi:MAG: hypothetical protein AAF550_11870, partial [Myxococcota bacterium]